MLPASILLFCLTALAPVATVSALPMPSRGSIQLPLPFMKLSRATKAPKAGFFNPPTPRASPRYTPTLRILEDDEDSFATPSFSAQWLADELQAKPSTLPIVSAQPLQRRADKDELDASIFSELLLGAGGYESLETARLAIASPSYTGRRIPVRELGSAKRRAAKKARRQILTINLAESASKPTATANALPVSWVHFDGETPELPEALPTPTFHRMHPGPVQVTRTSSAEMGSETLN